MRSRPRQSAKEIETCARCHSRRGRLTDNYTPGQPFTDGFRPALLESGLYYPDGQMLDEVYNYGSFLQSRMNASGVTCSDCHEPHSQQLRAAGNGVCVKCHSATKFDTIQHHHHPPASKGAECAACHMPTKTYMVIDPRHDHSIRIPRPDLSERLGTPNACNNCHSNRNPAWAAQAVEKWFSERDPGFEDFAEAFAGADPSAAAAHHVLGLSLVRERRLTEAIGELTRAATLAPRERGSLTSLQSHCSMSGVRTRPCAPSMRH